MVLSTDCTKASDELPFHYHEALIPYESERSSFSKPAVKQWARKVNRSSCNRFLRDRAERRRAPSGIAGLSSRELFLKVKDDES